MHSKKSTGRKIPVHPSVHEVIDFNTRSQSAPFWSTEEFVIAPDTQNHWCLSPVFNFFLSFSIGYRKLLLFCRLQFVGCSCSIQERNLRSHCPQQPWLGSVIRNRLHFALSKPKESFKCGQPAHSSAQCRSKDRNRNVAWTNFTPLWSAHDRPLASHNFE